MIQRYCPGMRARVGAVGGEEGGRQLVQSTDAHSYFCFYGSDPIIAAVLAAGMLYRTRACMCNAYMCGAWALLGLCNNVQCIACRCVCVCVCLNVLVSKFCQLIKV